MACDTFLKIVQKCKRKFVIVQVGENEPFVSELLTTLPTTIADLEPHQIHSFYESVGNMIQAEPDRITDDDGRLEPNQRYYLRLGNAKTYLQVKDVVEVHDYKTSVSQHSVSDPHKRDEYLQRLMELPNQKWAEIIGKARQSVDFLKDPDVIRAVLNILQVGIAQGWNTKLCYFLH
ncbi:hypothetical protein ACS0TY_027084 [Phlomoides rotata]